ncbi:hypothetical protein VTI74DRAFT_3414 [Chaetomium olivicolor]
MQRGQVLGFLLHRLPGCRPQVEIRAFISPLENVIDSDRGDIPPVFPCLQVLGVADTASPHGKTSLGTITRVVNPRHRRRQQSKDPPHDISKDAIIRRPVGLVLAPPPRLLAVRRQQDFNADGAPARPPATPGKRGSALCAQTSPPRRAAATRATQSRTGRGREDDARRCRRCRCRRRRCWLRLRGVR